jgi:hypothetical protein
MGYNPATSTFLSVCLFIATRVIFQLSGGSRHYRWHGCKSRPMLGAQGLWAGRDLYRATPTATRDLGLYGLIRKTDTQVPQWDWNPNARIIRSLRPTLYTNHCATRVFVSSWLCFEKFSYIEHALAYRINCKVIHHKQVKVVYYYIEKLFFLPVICILRQILKYMYLATTISIFFVSWKNTTVYKKPQWQRMFSYDRWYVYCVY